MRRSYLASKKNERREMIYLIAVIVGLLLATTLEDFDETSKTKKRRKKFIAAGYAQGVLGALFGVIFFINLLGVRLTSGYLYLEAILWSLLGALIIRLITQVFSYETHELEKLKSEPVAAQDYLRTRKNYSKNKNKY